MSERAPTTFLTGSSGFIGQYVLRGLLQRGHRVIVMLRGPVGQSRLRLAQIMSPLGVDVENQLACGKLFVVQGSLPDLIPPSPHARVDHIVHSAACVQLETPLPGEPFATNVEGVKALARWADRQGVPEFHFVSTAYTCGREVCTAEEVLHDPQPPFATDYELSKWQAEHLLTTWAARSGRRLTILRPSLVIGDSRTGYTTQYGGFYQMAHMIEILQRFFGAQFSEGRVHLPLRLPGSSEGRQNIVPVDYVADAIVEIVNRAELHGRIYHLTNPHPPTNGDIKRWLEAYYRVWGGSFVDDVDTTHGHGPAERMFFAMNDVVLKQLKFVPEFDCRNTLAALAGSRVRSPRLNQAAIFRMLDFAMADKWGRLGKAAAS